MREIPLNELLTTEKYRSMTKEDLKDVIGGLLSLKDYTALPGRVPTEKAKLLLQKWESEKLKNKTNDPQKLVIPK